VAVQDVLAERHLDRPETAGERLAMTGYAQPAVSGTVRGEVVLRVRTRKPMLWFKFIAGHEVSCEIAQGEPCEYFAHSDTYVFAGREGVAPWFSRGTVEANPAWFEAEHNTTRQPEPASGDRLHAGLGSLSAQEDRP